MLLRRSRSVDPAHMFRTRSIADLGSPDAAGWQPTGNGTTASDVTNPQRALARPTMQPGRTGMSETVEAIRQPTPDWRTSNYWPHAQLRPRTVQNNFNPGDRRRCDRAACPLACLRNLPTHGSHAVNLSG